MDDRSSYVITIPGVQDVLSIPPLEDEQLKRERLTRWRINAQQTTIPEPLRWLPQIINWLDDAQDLLIVALTLGKPLLRKLPSRFVPYLGWALLANDLLNGFTGMLAAPLNPREMKVDFLKTTRNAFAGRSAHVRAAEAFLLPGRAKMIPFALQAGQVLYSFTGWGLRLGGIMQTISETWWGLYRTLTGQHVVISGPPAHDIGAKAARFLAQSYNWNVAATLLSGKEAAMLIAAQNLAMGLLGAPTPQRVRDEDLVHLAQLHTPTFDPWSPSSRAVLAEGGYPGVDDQRVATPTVSDRPLYSDALRACIAEKPDVDVELATEFRDDWIDWPQGLMASEASQFTWDVFASGVDFVVPLNSPMERMLGIALEQALVPPFLGLPADPKINALLGPGPVDADTGLAIPPFITSGPGYQHGFHFPIAYPAPEDPNAQLMHWCAIALAIYCKRKLAMPIYEYDFQANTVTVREWGKGSSAPPLNCMREASILIWGNYWVRNAAPVRYDPVPSLTKTKLCFPNPSGWPALTNRVPEWPAMQFVLYQLPKLGSPARQTPFDNQEIVRRQSRDWLDFYLKQQDARRYRGPKWPDPAALPEPPAGSGGSDDDKFWAWFGNV